MQEMILIRGLPGSGKSTLARQLFNRLSPPCPKAFDQPYYDWYETDMFFGGNDHYPYREYIFLPEKLKEAHEWCQGEVQKVIESGHSVIVSNTFSRIWEMQPYLDLAKSFGAKVTVLTCEGNYGNVHGVPESTIVKMKARWEPYYA